MKYKILFSVLSVVLLMSCYKEDALTPSDYDEFKYYVPQGDHDYDAYFVDWYTRCGFYILYQFDPKDCYFNIYEWLEPDTSGVNSVPGKIEIVPADENYVGQMYQVLDKIFFSKYSDKLLGQCMPMKLLLCSRIFNYRTNRSLYLQEGFDFIAINYVNSSVSSFMNPDDNSVRKYLKEQLHKMFLQKAYAAGKITIPQEFIDLSDYTAPVRDNHYALGFLSDYWGDTYTKEEDWNEYVLAIITYNYDYLNMHEITEDYLWEEFVGMLDPERDINGLVRKKYNAVLRYFKDTFGVDLQAIGNDPCEW